MSAPPTFGVRLERARSLSPSVRELVFARVDERPMTFDAGQWVSLVLPLADAPDGRLRRAYSIASAPDGSPRFEIAVTKVDGGPGSTFLHAMPEGAVIDAVGPQGFFTRDLAKTGPSLFVATGTGITPLRSMLRAAVARGDARSMIVLYGNRTAADVLYRDELDALARERAHFSAEYTLSRPGPEWPGRRGWVQEHVRELWAELRARDEGLPHAYVCGLQRMVGAVRDLLRKELGATREQVHSERYD